MANMLEELMLAEDNVDSEQDRLVFPINVHDSLAASGSLKRGEKAGIIISFWVVGCIILAWVLASWLRQVLPAYYGWVVLAVEVLLQLTVGVFLLRFVLDENTLVSEMEQQDNSFAKYFSIYHEILAGEDSSYPFDVIEFSDGSYGVYIRFLLGYNTNTTSNNTYEINHTIQMLINKSGMDHKVVYSNEPFTNSVAADNLRNTVNQIKDPNFFKVYREVVQGYLKIASEESNVLCATYVIYAKTRIQKDDLTQLVTNILNTVSSEDSAYREVSTMSYDDIVEFYRSFYKLDVFDMGMVRTHTVQAKKVSCSLKLLRVYGKSGRVYNTADMRKLRERILADYGLEQMN